ncbi:MAG: hypothetical protein NVSMB5_23000 [Candidatus Velthaea sp.]
MVVEIAMPGARWFKPLKMLAPWRNAGTDFAGNRIKRLNEDDYTLLVSRGGLGPAGEGSGLPVTYERLRAAGCMLDRIEGERHWGIDPYGRDTNAVYSGSLRIIYDPDVI